MSRHLAVLLGAMLCAVLFGQSPARALVLVTPPPQSGAALDALAAVQRRIRDETGQALSIRSVPDSRAAMESALAGEADLALVPAARLSALSPDFYLFEGLFLFRGLSEAFEFLDVAENRLLVEALGDSPLVGISWWGGELLQLVGRRPLDSPADLVGRRLATGDERFRRLGAGTVPVPRGELVPALVAGSLEAAEGSLATAEALAEQASAITLTQHRFLPWMLVAHRGRWQSLAPEAGRAVEAILREAGRGLAAALVSAEYRRLESLRGNPRVTLVALGSDARQAWRQAVGDINAEVARRSGPRYQALLRKGFEARKSSAKRDRPPPAPAPPPVAMGGIAPPADRQPPIIHWNGWCETPAGQDVRSLEVGRRYRFSIDLSRFVYQAPFSSPAAGPIGDELAREGQISLLLQPVLVGGHLEAPPDEPLKPKLITIYRDRLQAAPNEAQAREAFAAGDLTTGEFAQAVNLGPRVAWDLVAREAGCGMVTLSVWDSARTRPLDHLIFSLPIAAAADAVAPGCATTGGSNIRSGLMALLIDPTAPATQPAADAALHIYETRGPQRTYSLAVFLNRDRFAAARENLAVEDPGIYAWELQSALSDYVSSPDQMLETIRQAHLTLRNYPADPYPFAAVGQELAVKIFSGKTPAQEAIARQALDSFRSLLGSRENPTCLVQLVSAEGETIYLPFGLLAARAAEPVVPGRFKVVQPLAYAPPPLRTACFSRWALAIPRELAESGGANTRLLNLERSTAPWMTEWVDTHADLLRFFQPQPVGDPAAGPGLGLILLAHHEGGYVWFNRQEQPRRILLEQVRRSFPPGSVALIAACSTSGAAPESRDLVHQLNRLGIEAMVISSLPVDAEFGTHLALEFMDEIRTLHESPRPACLGDILEGALKRAAARFPSNPGGFSEMALEFQVVGQYELTLCPTP